VRKLRVWWILLTQIGPAARLWGHTGKLSRYYVLKTLADEGLFDYLTEPRTYDQILAEFGFADSDYTRDLFEALVTDEQAIVLQEGNLYRLDPAQSLPTPDEIRANVAPTFHSFIPLFEGMLRYIPARLHNRRMELSESVGDPGRNLMDKFDETLGNRFYAALRNAAFAFLTRQDRAWLRGKKLLEVGCGSGRETADLWVRMRGDVHITAVDAVPSLLDIAERKLADLLDEFDPGHPPLTDANRPIFRVASAADLPFESNSFDAVYHVQMLQWTPDPHRSVGEIARVLKPGGLVFGAQGSNTGITPYMALGMRLNENCYGFFPLADYRRWNDEFGLQLEIVKPLGIFRARKQC
jgi:ubiquinone/menaquinone biosynthesis C-methylase UbiE